jgi:hypothetical protein
LLEGEVMAAYNRKDNDGHKYNIPHELLDSFDLHLKVITYAKWGTDAWYDAHDQLDNKFSQYMVG